MSNKDLLKDRFEAVLLDGLEGRPLVDAEGIAVTDKEGNVQRMAPESSFLSVCRAYLKDLTPAVPASKEVPVPATGPAKGVLKSFEQRARATPFGPKLAAAN